jgi:dihydroneopterin aldolase / 2-amino-4-hydroxy-6-hydroxymethyldihydropteridine diphosphokinase / dihydropteroate synthase
MRKIVSFPSRPYDEPSSPSDLGLVTWTWGTKTYLMATLNTTPDSFSDGGDHFSMTTATSYARSAMEAGADILDIGGYSTRPGSCFISPDEEIKRTVPVIQAMRRYEEENNLPRMPISVDTFRSDVAEATIRAGANCINDVYALTGPHVGVANVSVDSVVQDQDEIEVSDGGAMLRTAARLGVPVILMHSRGPADQNKDYSMYAGGVMEGVKKELGSRVQRALRAGLRRWNIILDPGIGFSKNVKGNLELMRRGVELNAATPEDGKRSNHELPIAARTSLEGYPVLIGTSRKAYLGQLTGKTMAKDREWATAAAVSAAIQQNADIIRVHKVDTHKDVLTISDAIYRTSQ